MIHELREYTFGPRCWLPYRDLFMNECLPIRGDDFGELVGAWYTVPAEEHVTMYSIWAYETLDRRAELRSALGQLPKWQVFLAKARELVRTQHLSVLHPVLRAAASDGYGGALYLNTYHYRPGRAASVIAKLRDSAVACWSAEFPDPNSVVCLAKESAMAELGQVDRTDSRRVSPLQPTSFF